MGEWAATLHAADSPQPTTHPPRKKESTRSKNLFEIHCRQVCGITRPVRLDNRATCIRYEALQRKNQQEHIVDFTDERNEVGNDVHRKQDVRDRSCNDELV